jgi:hypothetical protein
MRYISRLNSSNFRDRTLKSLKTYKTTIVLVYNKTNPLCKKCLNEFNMLSRNNSSIDWKYLHVNQNYLDNSFYVNKLLDTYNINSVPTYLVFNSNNNEIDKNIRSHINSVLPWYKPIVCDLLPSGKEKF